MLEQVRSLVIIKISVVTTYICSFVYTDVKNNNFAPSINAALSHYLGTYNLDFRRENNSTPGVLIEEIRYMHCDT